MGFLFVFVGVFWGGSSSKITIISNSLYLKQNLIHLRPHTGPSPPKSDPVQFQTQLVLKLDRVLLQLVTLTVSSVSPGGWEKD